MGRAGEQKATKYLKKLGYKILEKNYTTHLGEIDIIVKDGETIVFVEVKTRKDDLYGLPSQAVNYKKQEKYFAVATEYLVKNKLTDAVCRFDVVEICQEKINHIIDAFCM